MVKISTRFNQDLMKTFNKGIFRKGRTVFLLLCSLLVILGLIPILFADLLGFDEASVSEGIGLVVAGILLYPAMNLLFRFTQSWMNRSMSLLGDDNIMEFEFTETEFIARNVKGTTYEGYTKANYSIFWKVTETPESFLLNISRSQSFVVPKNAFVEGSMEELLHIFKHQLPPKVFVPMKKKLKK